MSSFRWGGIPDGSRIEGYTSIYGNNSDVFIQMGRYTATKLDPKLAEIPIHPCRGSHCLGESLLLLLAAFLVPLR